MQDASTKRPPSIFNVPGVQHLHMRLEGILVQDSRRKRPISFFNVPVVQHPHMRLPWVLTSTSPPPFLVGSYHATWELQPAYFLKPPTPAPPPPTRGQIHNDGKVKPVRYFNWIVYSVINMLDSVHVPVRDLSGDHVVFVYYFFYACPSFLSEIFINFEDMYHVTFWGICGVTKCKQIPIQVTFSRFLF